ncbi:integrase catalytic domain-containing protein [Trichonephila clavata]|uniref:Integrase catalytic domain-containing protein n=1 Tax=Trichonephila clavata TaxID=2740835 RepID=A0A8X6IFN2_TRICU|nr:integrase catalytic domain-containing protein [Trichonephila clavata]
MKKLNDTDSEFSFLAFVTFLISTSSLFCDVYIIAFYKNAASAYPLFTLSGIFYLVLLLVLMISGCASNELAREVRVLIQCLPRKSLENEQNINFFKKTLLQDNGLTLWKIYVMDRSLVICLIGTLLTNYTWPIYIIGLILSFRTTGLRGDSSAFKPYIKNRVQEIQLLSDPSQWGHCPGKDNPADLISRGTSAVKLAQNELWWHGPPWLKLTPDYWPNRHRDILDSELCSEELEYRSSVHVAVTQQRESLVDINRFSSLKKLLKVTAWVFRFVNNARIVNKSMSFYITADEIQHAEYFWLKYVQYEFYSTEILTLKRNEQLRCSSEIKSLVPYLGEDNLLITGRLLEANLCFGEKHPVILP